MKRSELSNVRLALVAFAWLAVAACRSGDEVPARFVSESRWAQQATMLAGTEARVDRVQLSETSVSQTWVVPVLGQWSKYRDEVVRRLEPEYRCRKPLADGLTCVRNLPGDHLELTLTPSRDARASLVVRARLHARAD